MQRRAILAGLGASASLLLAACATPTRTLPVTSDRYWAGRLSLQTQPQAEEQAQGFSASFELSGQSERGELVLTSPVGNRVAEIHWTADKALLIQGKQQQAFASLDELITRVTGTAIPVRALFDWLQGTATPVQGWAVDLSRQPEGRLSATRQWPRPVAQLRIVLETPN